MLLYSYIQRLVETTCLVTLSRRTLRGYCTAQPVRSVKGRGREYTRKHFVDFRRVHVIGGKGGDGCLSFLSLFGKEWAGPDGGDGGNGGHIILQAEHNTKSLEYVDALLQAENGVKGRNKHCHGKNAEHIYIKVPLGTIVKDKEGEVIASLETAEETYIIGRGGAGGKGNHFFLTNDNRAPVVVELGAKGEDKHVLLELRVMAHAGLVGFPNAGKSTLLRAISRARPKVAAYPFTTLNPHVGIVHYDDYEQIAVADIPGLIKDAHLNKGLGISFLRHIERCLCLLYVIDLSCSQPWTQLEELKFELDQYSPGLSERPHAIIGNKIDLPEAEQNLRELQDKVDLPIYPISAKRKQNIHKLLLHLRELYDTHSKPDNT